MAANASTFRVYCKWQLKDLIGKKADKANLPLSEYVAKVMAKHVGRPDLAVIPRKKMGRPRLTSPVAGRQS